MIKIIKQGTRKTQQCEKCGCIFSYDEEDVIQEGNVVTYQGQVINAVQIDGVQIPFDPPKGLTRSFINCPQCDNKIILNTIKTGGTMRNECKTD